jgi:tetratricopeptide (TPR) repeat protein
MTELDLTTAVNEIGELRVGPGSSLRFFFLIGAGISAPTIPLAAEITEQCRALAEKKGRGGLLGNSSSPLEEYSYWFERAFPQPAQRQEYLRSLISGRPISHANLRLAHLLLDPKIAQLVVTPNFDDQLSRALTLFGKAHVVCDHPRVVDRIEPQRSAVQILHVHGNYWFYDCCNLRGEIEGRAKFSAETSLTMASMLEVILANHSPLVIGYGGWNGDVIMEALRRRLSLGRRLPYKMYWFCFRRSEIEKLPEWLTLHPEVSFVIPTPSTTEEEARTPDSEDTSLSRGRTKPQEERIRLSATQVLDALVRALGLEAPPLTRDPLAFFAAQLRGSLPSEVGEAGNSDPYFFSGLADQVQQANRLAAAEKKDAQTQLEKVLDAIRRSEYEQAVLAASTINLEGLDLSRKEEFLRAMSLAASGLRTSKARLNAYQLVIAAGDSIVAGDPQKNESREKVADALFRKANALSTMSSQRDAALSTYDEIVARYADSPEQTLRSFVLRALANKAERLLRWKRPNDAISTCEKAVQIYGASPSSELHMQLAQILNTKGRSLGSMGSKPEALEAYDKVVEIYIDNQTEDRLLIYVVRALRATVRLLVEAGQIAKAIETLDRAIDAAKETSAAETEDDVASLFELKAATLHEAGRDEEALQVCESIIDRFKTSRNEGAKAVAAQATLLEARLLKNKGEIDRAILAFDRAIDDFGKSDDLELAWWVNQILLEKAHLLAETNEEEEALAVIELIEDRYRRSDGEYEQEVMTKASELKKRLTSKEQPSSESIGSFREFVRSKRAALAGFLEQGASLKVQKNILVVTPRNEVFTRYLRENAPTLADLASEFYSQPFTVNVAEATPEA